MDNSTTIDNNGRFLFSWYDYILFVLMLCLSALIGIYFGFFAKQKQSSVIQYLHGGKKMGVIPIALSLVASAVSGTTIMGVPTDVYRYGSTYIFSCIGGLGLMYISYKVYIPVFFKLQVISTYEYLEMRFNKHMRILSSAIFTITSILHMPMIIYAPALAFAQATGVNVYTICWLVSVICIFYTTIGGLKAVVWTDAIQFVLMVGSVLVVLFMGISTVGGISEVFRKAYDGDRLTYNYEFDPRTRDNFWALLIVIQFYHLGFIGVGQGAIQKYLALPTMSHIKKALILFIIGCTMMTIISVTTGIIIYANYADCDPISDGKIEKHDQILPYFIMDISQKLPGLAGLYISGLISAALSSLSSMINALCGTIYQDFISPFMSENTNQKTVSNILKCLVIIIGAIGTALVLLFDKLGSAILPFQVSMTGITMGALVGVFSLGMLVPMANTKGAIVGTVTSIVTMAIIISMSQMYQYQGLIHHPTKPISTHGCTNFFNTTQKTDINATIIQSISSEEKPMFIFLISPWYYSLMGECIVFLVGIPVSYMTRSKTDKPVSRDLISPVIHWCMPQDTTKEDNLYFSVDKALEVVYSENTENCSEVDNVTSKTK